MSSSPLPPDDPPSGSNDVPRYRPRQHFWPYVDRPEYPDVEEMASLDPDLRAALYGPPAWPFSITIVFPRFEGPDFEKALALAREAEEFREVGQGDAYRIRARFFPSTPLKLRTLFELVSQTEGCQVLIDDHPLPYARELWLPLVWFLIPR